MVHIRSDERGFPILDERAYHFNKLAYQNMNPQEIEMSERRGVDYRHKELMQSLEDLRAFQERSRKVLIRVSHRATHVA
ncbi:MAG: hypothetical protein WCP89_02470 [archaeon]